MPNQDTAVVAQNPQAQEAKPQKPLDDVELSIWEHLDELRKRLFGAVLALIIGTAVCVVFATQGLELLISPLGEYVPQTIHPTEGFVVYFRVAMIGGVTLAMPVIVYELVRFALPGLLPEERKYLYMLLPGVFLFFAGGVAFAAFIMIPAAVNFMQSFLQSIIDNRWTLDNYIGFVTRVLFWMGMVFQTPLIMFFLAKLGLVTPQKLSKFRKYAILLVAIIAAAVTPTPDPVNMMIVMVPLYFLYEVGIVLARVAVIGRQPAEETAAPNAPAG
jgi:sec-independent protein translocase protein TatC